MSNWLGLREDQRMGRDLSAEIIHWLMLNDCGRHFIVVPSGGRKSGTASVGVSLLTNRVSDLQICSGWKSAFASKLAPTEIQSNRNIVSSAAGTPASTAAD